MTTSPLLRRDQELMTLGDIALLAQVQRPVVTVWRGRPHVEAGPFPDPVARVGGQDRFDRAHVVEWLRRSGRGNNLEVAADAALHARPPVATPAGGALAEALLAVAAGSGEALSGMDREDLLDLAEEIDPDDRFACREIARCDQRDLLATAIYVDALLGAARGPQEALAHLRRDPSWFARQIDATAPAPHVVRLVGALAQALADPMRGQGAVPVADATGSSADLVLGVLAERSNEAHDGVWARPVAAGDDEVLVAATRESWRSLAIHGALPEAVGVDEEGHIEISGRAVVVARYPHPGTPSLAPERLLEEVDDVLVQLGVDQRAVILGPAAVLTDALDSTSAASMRRKVLDSGRLRALVRLGRGSNPAAPQRRLALWVFGPTPTGNFRRDGRTAVADLGGLDVTATLDDLVSDVVAAVEDRPLPPGIEGDEGQGRAHVFRVARYQATYSVLARDGDLVPRDLRLPPRLHPSTPQANPAAAATAVRSPLAGVPIHVSSRPGLPRGRVVTIRELLDGKRVRLVPGTRLVEGDLVDSGESVGGLAVVGVPELSGRTRPGQRTVDHLAFVAAHPRATRTEAGDVVFCIGPTVGAWVDVRGGTVIEAPARALRVLPAHERPDRVVPRILAADLANGQGGEWRAFPARLVPAATADTLVEVLESLAVARDTALRRVDDLDRLTDLLADGTVAGRNNAMMDSTEPEGH